MINTKYMKYDFERIVKRLDELIKEDDEINDAAKDLFVILSPDSYPIPISQTPLSGFLDAFDLLNNSLHHDLVYYAYEVKMLDKQGPHIKSDGKEYDFNNTKQLIEYLNKYYN